MTWAVTLKTKLFFVWNTRTFYWQARQSDLNLAAELEKLKLENEELREENELLRTKETELQLQVDNLLEELSRKEAEWCSKEEKLMLEVQFLINCRKYSETP